MNPFDYSLCDQTVTLYRKGAEITRQVISNASLQVKVSMPAESYGKSMEKKFLLIIPGDFPLEPGDRIYAGIGPGAVDCKLFVPALVPELFECGYVKPYYWENQVTHWEAGNRKETL